MQVGEIEIDPGAMTLIVRGNAVPTTATEFRLLDYFARHLGRVFTRDQLLDSVWRDTAYVTPRSVDVYVRRIREKIEPDPENPALSEDRARRRLPLRGSRSEKPDLRQADGCCSARGHAVTPMTLDVTVRRAWESSLREEIERNLRQKTLMFAQPGRNRSQHSFQDITSQEGQAAGARATVIDPTGKVLADSEADPAEMENHASRKEFIAALAGNVGVDERRSHTVGIPFLYVAAPVPEARCVWPIRFPMLKPRRSASRRTLLLGSAVAFVVVMCWPRVAAQYRRHGVCSASCTFAERIARRRPHRPYRRQLRYDEIGQVAAALDKTARRVEDSFLAVQTSQRQLETLLNSMQDAVIAVGADGRVQWANRGMDRLVPQRTRLNAPIVETVRDPDFLAAVRERHHGKRFASARAVPSFPGRSLRCDRRAYARTEAPSRSCGI